jgi:hypothetical protein
MRREDLKVEITVYGPIFPEPAPSTKRDPEEFLKALAAPDHRAIELLAAGKSIVAGTFFPVAA